MNLAVLSYQTHQVNDNSIAVLFVRYLSQLKDPRKPKAEGFSALGRRVAAVQLLKLENMLMLAGAVSGHTSICLGATNTQDTEYAVDLKVGTPPFRMRVAPDTGSYQLVLASRACNNCEGRCMGCPTHLLFDTASSTSYHSLGSRVISAYGQGSVDCNVGADVIELGSISGSARQMMQLIYNSSMGGFSTDSTYDGIMGLGVVAGVPVTDSDTSPAAPDTLSTLGIRYGAALLPPLLPWARALLPILTTH